MWRFSQEQILEVLPHRGPALLLDKAEVFPSESTEERLMGLGLHIVTEEDCEGHFPENPIFPGIKYPEALAQLAGVVAMHHPDFISEEGQPAFISFGATKFRKPTKPGDLLRLTVHIDSGYPRRNFVKATGTVVCNNQKVAEVSDILFTVINTAAVKTRVAF